MRPRYIMEWRLKDRVLGLVPPGITSSGLERGARSIISDAHSDQVGALVIGVAQLGCLRHCPRSAGYCWVIQTRGRMRFLGARQAVPRRPAEVGMGGKNGHLRCAMARCVRVAHSTSNGKFPNNPVHQRRASCKCGLQLASPCDDTSQCISRSGTVRGVPYAQLGSVRGVCGRRRG